MNEITHKCRSRRAFLGTTLAGATGLATARSVAADELSEGPLLTITGYPYERVRALQNGKVGVEGRTVQFQEGKIGELNQHVFNGPRTHDVSEVGLIPYLLAFCNDGFRDYRLLPIFVLKVFRHKSIFIHADRGIREPADLRGRRVATVGYSSSGLTWIRGVLEDEYGVSPTEIHWVQTTKDSAKGQTGGVSRWEKVIPDHVSITMAPEGKDESDLLLSGDVDAIFHPAEPRAFVERHPKVRRLFADCRSVEQAYFKKTGIFPIMHVVAIRRDLAQSEPTLVKRVFEAYSRAKQFDYQESRRIRWAYSSLPWFGQEFDETAALMGDNFYSYGLDQNRKAMQAACRYLYRQGLAKREMNVEELFIESSHGLKDLPG
jgi:4,5-dihydroxyphthalate decarboxylase